MNDIELLELIKEEYKRIKPITMGDFFSNRDKRIPCHPILRERFNKTYNEILIMAGIDIKDLNFVRRNALEYLEELRQVSLLIGYIPSFLEFQEMGYSPSSLSKHFGTYNNAIDILDLGLKRNKTPISVSKTKDELLQIYIEFSKELGRPANYGDLKESKGIHDASVFSIRFGGMMGLKKAAGFPIIDKNNSKYTKNEIMGTLINLYEENGGRIKVQNIKNNPRLPSYSTILKYFKTTKIVDVWEEIEQEIDIRKKAC